MWNIYYVLVALIAVFLSLSADADDGAKSQAVEKDGISATVAIANHKVLADDQPSLTIRLQNTSRDDINLYDGNAYWNWRIVFIQLDAGNGEPKHWTLKFDVIENPHSLAFKQLKPGEADETAVDLATDPPFTFTFVGGIERKEKTKSLRHLPPGQYEAVATVSRKDPFGEGRQLWTGPLTTAPVRFTVLGRNGRQEPTQRDRDSYEKAVEPVIKRTHELGGLWMNGGFPEIKIAKAADPEDVIAAVVNVNRSNIGTKAYRVLLIKRLEEEDGKRFVALIAVGKSTKALLCFPIAENRWWSRTYDASVEAEPITPKHS